jgi:putative FmdB family regulatory protein
MPLYDFECLTCGEVFENFCCLNELESLTIKQKCPHCKGKVKRLIGGMKKDWFQVHINEDFDGTPIEVTSKRHLKELCKKHGVTSRAL